MSAALLTAAVLSCAGLPRVSLAIGTLTLEAAEITAPDAQLAGVHAALDLTAPEGPRLRAGAKRIEAGGPLGTLRELSLDCPALLVEGPKLACREARVAARGGPTGSIRFRASADYDAESGAIAVSGEGLQLARSQARFAVRLDPGGWSATAAAEAMALPELRKLAAPWLELPADYALDGRLGARVEASGTGTAARRIHLRARVDGASFTNEASTVAGENLSAVVDATAARTRSGTMIDARVEAGAGQALAGPALLDFAANPLQLQARGALRDETLEVTALEFRQRNLIEAQATGEILLGERPTLAAARAVITSLQFPAAYTSFLQIGLAASDLGALETAGRLSGSLEVTDGRLTRLHSRLDDLDLRDTRGKFSLADLRGEFHWAADATGPGERSHLEWSHGSAFGLEGGRARIDFVTRGTGVALAGETRLPVFDGAIVVRRLVARELGAPQAELEFDALIEPISMPQLSRAFGWPELQGRLAGRVPGLTYRNRELAVEGDLVASVFDGTIVGSGFRLRDPFGPWPRLHANVKARRLDLELVTRTFSIGTITGRLDGDITGLELFAWSPVAFDARLYSTPGDKSPRLISQKAVTSISNIGGGAGSVTAALQSGVLRFFDRFRYDRIGIACRLRDEVCLMGGVERTGGGYYLVKGRGLPRIDIIGNAGRVDWPVLVSQIVAGMQSEGPVVR